MGAGRWFLVYRHTFSKRYAGVVRVRASRVERAVEIAARRLGARPGDRFVAYTGRGAGQQFHFSAVEMAG